jgi:hypothetical protein
MKKPIKLGEPVLKVLNKKYEPSTIVSLKVKGYDLAMKTDNEGNPILLFIGKMDEKGNVKGDRFARTLKKDQEGKIVKDHWDLKGKAT